MASKQTIILLLAVFAKCMVSNGLDEVESNSPIKDGFRLVVPNIDEGKVKEEVEDFALYGCEKMAVIRNKAEAEIRLTCTAGASSLKEIKIQPGKAIVFSFRPLKNGSTKAYCQLEYMQHIARFDIYNENLPYMCPREVDEVYQYTVTHAGVYVDGKADSEGTKIRALFKGHNKFMLWEEYQNEEVDGYLMAAFVDGGMCSDVPDQFNDKTAAVTVCYNHCVQLYEHYGCSGNHQTVEVLNDCIDVPLDANLAGKLSAVKGC